MAGLFNDIKNKALNTALNIADAFTPVLKESKFRETGFITPEEFVTAGDFLTGHCPTWQWAVVTNPKACKDYLPRDKQFLVTKNVPCSKRCAHLMDSLKDNQEKVVEVETGDGGWVDTHYSENVNKDGASSSANNSLSNQVQEIIDHSKQELPNIKQLNTNTSTGNASNENEDEMNDEDEEPIDMDEYDHNVIEEDDTTVVTAKSSATTNAATNESNKSLCMPKTPNNSNAQMDTANKLDQDDEDRFIPTRTYDLNITYDNYYRTPRLWLSGYDENHKPLTIEQMYDDISEDHAKKTVTFETHPHIPGTLMASIHPCRHAEVMKKLINLVAESGKELEVYSYLMVFLKFVQSVIPTIEYDYTRNITI
jgi:ubiquitin-like-conjugating enzyme ATG3